MTQPTSRSCRDVLVTVLCVLLYAGAVTAYTVWSYREHRTTLMEQIDSRLLQAARSLKYLLAEDFHDRALGPDSISREEELRNRKLVTSFGVESGFAWVHTIAEADGRFYFSAPSVSEEEAQDRKSGTSIRTRTSPRNSFKPGTTGNRVCQLYRPVGHLPFRRPAPAIARRPRLPRQRRPGNQRYPRHGP
jgi:hypothetical protein